MKATLSRAKSRDSMLLKRSMFMSREKNFLPEAMKIIREDNKSNKEKTDIIPHKLIKI